MNELPTGWKKVALADIGKWGSGGTPLSTNPHYYNGDVPWIRSGDLPDGPIIEHIATITQAGLESSAAKWIPADTILIALYGATIGKLGLTTYPITTNQAIAYCIPHTDSTISQYLFWYFLYFRPELISLAQGGAQPNISQAILKKHYAPIPPISEQTRIVARIEKLFARIRRIRADLDRISSLVTKQKQSLIDAAYHGNFSLLSNDDEHNFTKISSLIMTLSQGWSPRCENFSTTDPKRWAVITTTAVQAMSFDPSKNKVLPAHLSPREHLLIKPGDVLITRAGPRQRVGVCCVVKHTKPQLILCDKVYRLAVNKSRVLPGFLAFILNSTPALAAIEEMKTGINDSGLNLTQGKFLELMVPVFNLADQTTIITRLENAFLKIDRLAKESRSAHRLLDHLEQSILAKAFRGELVPQNSIDEQAEKNLNNIHNIAPKFQHQTNSSRSKATQLAF